MPGIAKAEPEERAFLPKEPGVHALRCSWAKKLDDAGVTQAAEEAVAALVKAGLAVREVNPTRSSLEEVFAELTAGESAARETSATEEPAS